MRKVFLFLLILFTVNILSNILASCTDSQININTASLEELDKLSGIGPVRAQAIIDTRPFSSVDKLIDVVGIGEVTLEKIKQQGLACVEGEETQENQDSENTQSNQQENTQGDNQNEETSQDEEDNQNADDSSVKENVANEDVSNDEEETKTSSPTEESTKITSEGIKTIDLSPKDIKSESNKEQMSKDKFAIYGLIIFCILLIILFGFKRRKDEKTEFR